VKETDIGLPTRDVLAKVAQGDPRMIRWFEDMTKALVELQRQYLIDHPPTP
jgi:hypothetical protein